MAPKSLLLLAALAAQLCAQSKPEPHSPADEALVESYFPQWMIDRAIDFDRHDGFPARVEYNLARLDLDNRGSKNYLVALYTTFYDTAIYVFRDTAAGPQLVARTESEDGGMFPEIETEDVEGDHRPEVLVNLAVGARQATAIDTYRWNGESLVQIAPTLLGGGYEDIDGDGKLEAVESGNPTVPEITAEYPFLPEYIYKLENGRYSDQPWRVALVHESFIRFAGMRDIHDRPFAAMKPGPGYLMRVKLRPEARFTSAAVFLNGRQIKKLSALSRYPVEIPVTLNEHNVLRVVVVGPSRSGIDVHIDAPAAVALPPKYRAP